MAFEALQGWKGHPDGPVPPMQALDGYVVVDTQGTLFASSSDSLVGSFACQPGYPRMTRIEFLVYPPRHSRRVLAWVERGHRGAPSIPARPRRPCRCWLPQNRSFAIDT